MTKEEQFENLRKLRDKVNGLAVSDQEKLNKILWTVGDIVNDIRLAAKHLNSSIELDKNGLTSLKQIIKSIWQLAEDKGFTTSKIIDW